MLDRKLIASGIYASLARADIELRRKRRGVFRKVDRIKRDPCWMSLRVAMRVSAMRSRTR